MLKIVSGYFFVVGISSKKHILYIWLHSDYVDPIVVMILFVVMILKSPNVEHRRYLCLLHAARYHIIVTRVVIVILYINASKQRRTRLVICKSFHVCYVILEKHMYMYTHKVI